MRPIAPWALPALYVPFDVEQFGDFWLEIVESEAIAGLGLALGGLSITTPHKEVAFAVAGATSPLSERLQAVNTLTPRRRGLGRRVDRRRGRRRGAARERRRAARPSRRGRRLRRRRPRGGARTGGRRRAGRAGEPGPERGRAAARALGLPFVPLADLENSGPSAARAPADGFEVYVHATPLGRRDGDETPLPVAGLAPGAVVVDLVYGESPTPLVVDARRRGLRAIDGREVLLYQAIPQFRSMTGNDLPVELGGGCWASGRGAREAQGEPAGGGLRRCSSIRRRACGSSRRSSPTSSKRAGFAKRFCRWSTTSRRTSRCSRRGARELYRFADRDGELLALRSDFTPLLARLLAPHLAALELPLRLFYRGDVVRCPERGAPSEVEQHQIGGELLGSEAEGPGLEREAALACARLLAVASGGRAHLVLGFAGALDELLVAAVGRERAPELARAIARRERSASRLGSAGAAAAARRTTAIAEIIDLGAPSAATASRCARRARPRRAGGPAPGAGAPRTGGAR